MALRTSEYIVYLFYRCLQATLTIIQLVIFNVVIKLPGQTSKYKAQVGKIIWRKKVLIYDTAFVSDFCWIHSKFTSAERIIKDPTWTLYAVCSRYAMFVKQPHLMTDYSIDKYPFFFVAQFETATLVAWIPIADFCSITTEVMTDDNKKKIVILAHTPRSGSTLLSQMLQAANKKEIFVISEPMVFTMITVLLNNKIWSCDLAADVIRASLYSYVLNSGDVQTLAMKLDSQATIICPIIRRVYPESKILFTHRRDLNRLLQSNYRLLKALSFDSRIRTLFFLFPTLCTTIFPQYTCHDVYQLSLPSRIESDMEFAAMYALKPYQDYKKCKSCFEDICPIHYEDLVSNTRQMMEKIADVLQLQKVDMDEVLQCLTRDSQQNSTLTSWGSKIDIQCFEDKRVQDKVNRLLEYMEVM